MTAGPATSFRDLANLGWPIKQIFDRANAQRGGTMRSMSDLAINDGFAAKWGWYCYNIVKGGLRQANSPPSNISSTETVWSYDNSKNFQPHTEEWSESWTETTTVTASVTSRASISLNYSITIFNVASSGLSIEISTESTKSETKESVHQLSVTWPIEVGPGEILSINRTITRTTGTSVYEQDYGVSGKIGTDGKKWRDHYYWYMDANWLLDNPTGTLKLQGYMQSTSFKYTIVRIRPGQEPMSVELPKPIEISTRTSDKEEIVKYMMAAPDESDAHEDNE